MTIHTREEQTQYFEFDVAWAWPCYAPLAHRLCRFGYLTKWRVLESSEPLFILRWHSCFCSAARLNGPSPAVLGHGAPQRCRGEEGRASAQLSLVLLMQIAENTALPWWLTATRARQSTWWVRGERHFSHQCWMYTRLFSVCTPRSALHADLTLPARVLDCFCQKAFWKREAEVAKAPDEGAA